LKATKRARPAAFRLRGTTVPIIAIQVADFDLERLEAEVARKVEEAAGSLKGALALIDLSGTDVQPPPLAALAHMARRFGMHPVAVTGIDEASEDAKDLGLAVLPSSPLSGRTQKAEPDAEPESEAPQSIAQSAAAPQPAPPSVSPTPPPAQAAATSPAAAAEVPVCALVIDKPVRSGQRIYARGCDLVLLNSASAGSELIADGNIHCYGPLRGRALAGASGDHDAQIFALDFQAELVSIAGIYKAFERLPEEIHGKAVRASLLFSNEQPQIVLGPLTASRSPSSTDSNKRPSA